MFVFYNWPFPQVYFAKKVGILFSLSCGVLCKESRNIIFPFNSWLSFQWLHHLLWGYIIRPQCNAKHKMQPTITDVLMSVGLCTTARCSLQLEMLSLLDTSVSCAKMAINWSRSCLWCGLTETQGTMYYTGTQIIHEKRHFRGDVLGHTKNGSQRGSTHIDFE